jgi:H+/Cl- antiporter ClcA
VTLNIIMAFVTGAALAALVIVLFSRRRPKKKKEPEQNPLEFSKRIFIGLSVLAGAVAVYVAVMVWRTEDVSVTQVLIDNAFALLKVGVVSYFGKAALENRVKLAHFYPKLREHIMNDRGGDP